MRHITRLSLALMMFSLFSVSYLVTSVSADPCMEEPAGPARDNCHQNSNPAPGSAAAGHMNSGGNDCMQHPAGPARDTCFQNSNPASGSAAARNPMANSDFCRNNPNRDTLPECRP